MCLLKAKFISDFTDCQIGSGQFFSLAFAISFLPRMHNFFIPYQTEQITANMALLQNLMNDAEELLPNFEHITFIQGGKAYGAHLGMYRTPAKETNLRCFLRNFYYDQEDYLREKSKGRNLELDSHPSRYGHWLHRE